MRVAVQRFVIHEQLARRIEALDAQLTAHDVDEPLVLDAILGEKVRRTGLQRVHGEELVAVRGEHQHGRAIAAAGAAAAGNSRPSCDDTG